jgi:hypothetical protein
MLIQISDIILKNDTRIKYEDRRDFTPSLPSPIG